MTTTQTTPSTQATRPRPAELAHYTANAQERVLIGHRVDGQRRITDAPAGGTGRSYLVETDIQTHSEVLALVGDYLAQAAAHDAIPMATTVLH